MTNVHCIRHITERVWLLEYDETFSPELQKLKWTWTLEWTRATRYSSPEAARARGRELGVTDAYVEGDYNGGTL